jgi:hypothetical protein
LDLQISVNAALGLASCGSGDVDGNGRCNVIDLQRLANAARATTCRVGP